MKNETLKSFKIVLNEMDRSVNSCNEMLKLRLSFAKRKLIKDRLLDVSFSRKQIDFEISKIKSQIPVYSYNFVRLCTKCAGICNKN